MPILDWMNKKQALTTADKTPYKVLVENKDLSYGDQSLGNMIIKGDNLEALKALLPYYKGQVKCIYIDPPYNTGNAFEHYDDNLEHSIWLSLMYPRLELLRELLSEEGCIFVQIDDNEQAYLKVIMDEIFGRNNFICNFIWQKKTGASDANNIAVITEYILCYAKKIKAHLIDFNRESFDYKRYRLSDKFESERGKYYIDNLDRGGLQYSDSLNYGIECPDGTITFPNGRKNKINDGWIWKWSKKKVDWAIENDFLEFRKSKTKESGWSVCYKNYLFVDNENKPIERSAPYKNLILDVLNNDANKETKYLFGKNKFNYPKPELLISHFISISSKKNDLILDSFLGSGTTCAVAQKMNRRYIGIERGEHAITHCVPRLKKVIDGTDESGISKNVNWKGGGGYTFYDLGNSIFDTKGNINTNIKFKDLAFHVWFSETKTPLKNYKHSPLIGIFKDTAYYLLYNGILGDKSISGGNVLTSKLLAKLQKYNGKKIIYGEVCRLSAEKLLKENIIFKQTPYDIKAR